MNVRRACTHEDEAPTGLIGTWRLVAFTATIGDGQVTYPFGTDASGTLTYTCDERVWASVWKADRRPFASNDQQDGTPEEYMAALQSYVQYNGNFTVDSRAGTVSHHIEQSVFPNWNATTQTRFYALSRDGDELSLTTPPTPFGGTTLVAALVWRRAK